MASLPASPISAGAPKFVWATLLAITWYVVQVVLDVTGDDASQEPIQTLLLESR